MTVVLGLLPGVIHRLRYDRHAGNFVDRGDVVSSQRHELHDVIIIGRRLSEAALRESPPAPRPDVKRPLWGS
jgi:hypothetical protein